MLLYAVDFGVLITEVTQSLVLCTLVSAPLMLVTAQLASLTIEGSSDYATLLQVCLGFKDAEPSVDYEHNFFFFLTRARAPM